MTAHLRFTIKLILICGIVLFAIAFSLFGAVTGHAPPFHTFYIQTNGYRWVMFFDLLSQQRIGLSLAVTLMFLFAAARLKWPRGLIDRASYVFQHAAFVCQFAVLALVICICIHQVLRLNEPDWFIVIAGMSMAAAVMWSISRPSWNQFAARARRVPVMPVLLAAAFGILLLGFSQIHFGQAIITDAQSQIAEARLILTGQFRITLSDELLAVAQIPNFLPSNPTYSQYPPGHIILLLPFIAARLAGNILNVVCGVVAVYFAVGLCRSIGGRRASIFTGLLLITSPLFVTMQSSAMNHGSTTLMLVVAAWAFYQVAWRGRSGLLWVGVLALGWAGITRPLTALCHAAVWTPVLGLHFYRMLWVPGVGEERSDHLKARLWRSVSVAIVVGAVPVGLLALYNWLTTGNPLLMGYIANNPEMHRLGFHADGPYPYKPAEAVQFVVSDVLSLSLNMFGWPMSSWVLIFGWLLLSRLTTAELIVGGLILVQSVVYRFYHFYDLLIGPRFVSELIPFYAILGGIGIGRLTWRLKETWRRVANTVILAFSVTAVFTTIRVWSDKLSMFTKKHVQVEEFLNRHPVGGKTRVIVVPWNYAETGGEYTFGGTWPTWFVLEKEVQAARKAPELEGAEWFWLMPTRGERSAGL